MKTSLSVFMSVEWIGSEARLCLKRAPGGPAQIASSNNVDPTRTKRHGQMLLSLKGQGAVLESLSVLMLRWTKAFGQRDEGGGAFVVILQLNR